MTELTSLHKEALALFAAELHRLDAAIGGMPDSALDLSLAPGDWTIRQVVHHLADDGDAWSMCVKKAIAAPGAPIRFEGFPGNDAWGDALGYDRRDIEPAVALIKAHRHYLARLLEDLPDTWDRAVTALDAQGQAVQKFSAREMIVMLTEHMAEHAATIEAIKARHHVH